MNKQIINNKRITEQYPLLIVDCFLVPERLYGDR